MQGISFFFWGGGVVVLLVIFFSANLNPLSLFLDILSGGGLCVALKASFSEVFISDYGAYSTCYFVGGDN